MGYFEQCKAKGIKLSLSWAQGRYWKKKVAGKQHYFKSPNSAAGYEAALAEWAKSQEPPEPPDPHEHRPFLRRVCEWYENHDDPDGKAKQIRIYLAARYTSKEKRFLGLRARQLIPCEPKALLSFWVFLPERYMHETN